MADKKVTELTAITSVSGDDLLLVVNDPLGTPASRKVTLKNFFSEVPVVTTVTANAEFSGTKVTMSANLMLSSLSSETTLNAYDSISDRMQVANTTLLVNDRIQMANVAATYISLSTLQTEVAASADFDAFKTRIAAL